MTRRAFAVLGALILAVAVLAVAAPAASAAAGGRTQGAAQPASGGASLTAKHGTAKSNGNCSPGAILLGTLDPFDHCNPGQQIIHVVAGLPGAVANGVMGDVSQWMVGAATTVLGFVEKAATSTSTPELTSAWYQGELKYLAVFAAAIAGLVSVLGIASAALRRDPYALGDVVYGMFRAGILTGIVLPLTVLALKVVDGVSGDIVAAMPAHFFQTLADSWGKNGLGGLGSSALAFLVALVEVVVAVFVWIELMFRDAAIYVAVLFVGFALAASIWPALEGTLTKLTRVLVVFVLFKPVALIIMLTGGELLLGGVSFYGGLTQSVGTIFAGLVTLAMAAFAPWALMHLVGLDAGVMSTSRRGGGAGGGSAGGGLNPDPVHPSFASAMPMLAAAGGGGAVAGGAGGGASAGAGAGGGGGGGSNGGGGSGGGIAGRVGGPLAAAAGMLGSAVSAGQRLGDHGAARVYTAAGYGGYAPSLASGGQGTNGGAGNRSNGEGAGSPPVPPGAPGGDPGEVNGAQPGQGAQSATPSSPEGPALGGDVPEPAEHPSSPPPASDEKQEGS
jgi:type IV secretion system protein TrbL